MREQQIAGLIFVIGLICFAAGIYLIAGTGLGLVTAGCCMILLAFVWMVGARNGR